VETTRIGTWIVKRQSCGCLPEIVQAAGAEAASAMPSAKESPRLFKDHLAQAMLESLLDETSPANIREIRPLCDRLVDSFIQSLQDGDLSHFQVALIDILQRVEIMQDDAHAWQAAISVLRQGLTSLLQDEHGTRRRERAEDLLHQARTMLSESARRKYTRLQLQQSYHDEAMGRLTARLLSTLDEDLVYDTVKENLPQIGIRNCHVVFFQEENGNPTASCITRPLEKDVRGIRFASNQFPPPGLMPESESYDLALLPLCFQEENLGFVAFDGAQLEPLASVIRQLASAIKSTQLHSQVLELSLTDSLTGVHNRRYFEILLQKEIERCQRYNRYLAVIMIDIDLFKEYNDAFGHLAGDEALREVAQCVSRGARRGLDVVTRYGGEEFTIILPETDANGAIVVAEHVRQLVETDSKFLRTVAISLGVAAQRGDQLRLQALVGQADKALYQAKQQGRNRSVVYEDWMVEAAHSATGEDSQTASLPTSEGE
jgi:diguanylate cyclase (GGDEF)-like protein